MKKFVVLFIATFIGAIALFGCDDSTLEDDFEEVNGDVSQKLIKRFEVIVDSGGEDNVIVYITYDGSDRVSSISDGESTTFLNYDSSNSLTNVVDSDSDPLNVSELYQAPYDAFDQGDVLEYDNNSNPIKILIYEDGFNSNALIGEISYDSYPNPFFYTFKAAGIIDVLDKVELNFGSTNPLIMKAKQLFPNNNISGMIFKDSQNITQADIQFDYVYHND